MIELSVLMTSSIPEHEKLFDEICSKLNELSTTGETVTEAQPKVEKMQDQMKKFHSELKESQEELREKIRSLENVSFGTNAMSDQVKQLADQLNNERMTNTKLGADLAKSLELCLQLQLEIQGLKARSMQMQTEEKKYSQALLEKNKGLQHELELAMALKDETAMELAKAKAAFIQQEEAWKQTKHQFEKNIADLHLELDSVNETVVELESTLATRDNTIDELKKEISEISAQFSEVESSAEQQSVVLKNLMDVAEGKIVEMKLALDKKTLEAQDYYSHLKQAITQANVLKQENIALKDYITKLSYYHQQVSQAQQQQAQLTSNQST